MRCSSEGNDIERHAAQHPPDEAVRQVRDQEDPRGWRADGQWPLVLRQLLDQENEQATEREEMNSKDVELAYQHLSVRSRTVRQLGAVMKMDSKAAARLLNHMRSLGMAQVVKTIPHPERAPANVWGAVKGARPLAPKTTWVNGNPFHKLPAGCA